MGSLEILFLTYYNHSNISTNYEMKLLVVYVLCLATLASAGWWKHSRKGGMGGMGRRRQPAATKKPTIAEAAIATESLSTLVAAVKAAGLVSTLNGSGTFTVFAPTNDAFAKIPANALGDLLKPENVDKLKKILLRHVLGSVIKAGDIPRGSTVVPTLSGEKIKVTKSNAGVTITSSAGQANVIKTDILASNGVVHLVGTVF